MLREGIILAVLLLCLCFVGATLARNGPRLVLGAVGSGGSSASAGTTRLRGSLDQPGWAMVSTHDDDVDTHTWMDDEVFIVELAAGGRVARLAHTHSLVDENEPTEHRNHE